ncbi:MAG: hypothetical protein IJ493_03260 [Clostridia bacterium]|nr:hypothetical protein [Clostridia bacterium]
MEPIKESNGRVRFLPGCCPAPIMPSLLSLQLIIISLLSAVTALLGPIMTAATIVTAHFHI